MIKRIQNNIALVLNKLDIHTLEVVKKSSSSTLVKVAGMITAVIISITLGRTLGPNGLGIINLSSRIVNILMVITMFGMENVLIKEIAIAYNKNNYQHIGDCMHSSFRFNGFNTLIIVSLFVLLTPWLSKNLFHNADLTIPLIIAIIAMIPMVFSRIFSSALIGYRKIWQSNLVKDTLSMWVIGILLLGAFLLKIDINVINVAVMYAIGRLVVFLSIGTYWRTLFKPTTKKQNLTPQLIKTAIPLLMVSASSIVFSNADAVMLGMLRGTHEVGLYTVATRIALLTSFFLQVTNSSVAPKIAALFNEGKKDEMERMIQRVTRGLLWIGLATWIIFIALGKWILSIWGDEFTYAYWILIILGFGQLINLGTGAVGVTLIMTGYEKIQSRISIIFLGINIILNFLFIYFYGAIGAATATCLTMIGINITKYYYVYKNLGIKSI